MIYAVWKFTPSLELEYYLLLSYNIKVDDENRMKYGS